MLSSLENINTDKLSIEIFKTGIVYDTFPDTPYKTDFFLIKDFVKNIQYEIYAVNIKGEYEIVEITEINGDKYLSSVHKDERFKELSKKVNALLSSSQ